MRRLYTSIIVVGLVAASAANAQTTAPTTVAPTATPGASATTTTAPMLTDEQAKAWVNKRVYSSDGKNLGEVAEMIRDSSGHVIGMQADIGGFLGIGETRIDVKPAQFTLAEDRVNLALTADQAKALPQVKK